jgi:subtilisin family serine protease
MRTKLLALFLVLLLTAPQPIAAIDTVHTAPPPAMQVQESPIQLSITAARPQPQQTTPPLTRFEPSLLKKLLAGTQGAPVRAIVMMREQPDVAHFDLAGLDRTSRAGRVMYQLQAVAEHSQASVRSFLAEAQAEQRVRAYKPLWIVNGIAVEGSEEILWELATHPDVSIILEDHVHYLPQVSQGGPEQLAWQPQLDEIQWNVQRVHADSVWESLGITGESTVVANLDSGVDWEHPYLKDRYRGYTGKPFVEHDGNWYCATDEGYTYPGDGHGHGTHTMGTMVGQDGIGVAPGARWIAAKIFDNQGFTYDSWIHDGFQWVLAPNGDPALAPDVVNNSWGNAASGNEQFRPDVQALRAAGIVPLFSAGNDGPASETIGSPASLQESLAVGATDRDDLIARFSSRGPSPWGETKPEVSAPGVDILSTRPGGAFGTLQGTSMAVPHVASIAALVRQANPGLTVDEIEAILLATAIPMGEERPNNDYGWGLVDAYAAVVRAGNFGRLRGQVTDASSGVSIADATIRAVAHGGVPTTTTTSDASGYYTVGLGTGHYDVTVSAFGYASQTAYGIEITTGVTTTLDVALDALPTGTLQGIVQEMGTGLPLQATLYVPGAPPSVTSDPGSGAYNLVLPAGTHTIRAEATAHRYVTATVTIWDGVTTYQDFALQPAPTILLVDSGAWYNSSQRQYYEQALQDLHYIYDRHIIANVDTAPTDIPTETTFLPYDVVIWSAPLDAPGLIYAMPAITTYLAHGGRLFLSGQDVAFWDGGGSGITWSPYLRDYLKATYVREDASNQVLHGQGSLFAGLTITIAGTGGADNQQYPDVIALTEADHASSVWTYVQNGSGGQAVGDCLPYRALFLSFGFEAINDAASRRQVMQRSIDWLVSPRRPAGAELVPGETLHISPPGGQITHTIRLRNTGEVATDTYTLILNAGAWPAQPLYPLPLTLGACQTSTLQIVVDVPPGLAKHTYSTATLVTQSALSTTVSATATLRSKTPAPVLLVDGSRWFRLDGTYRDALEGAGIQYDYHRVKGVWPNNVPTDDVLSWYPMLVWYTAYDWYRPLSDLEEARLITYLEDSGRLFLSSQDYLYYKSGNPLAYSYLGVFDYEEGLETDDAWGEPLHPIGWGLGPYTLTYTYTNWSDTLVPITRAQVYLRGQHKSPTALTNQGGRWKTAFTGFSFETLDASAAQTVMDRTVGWLSWLGGTSWQAHQRVVSGGDQVTMTAILRNDGGEDIAAHLVAPLPAELSFVGGSLSLGATYHPLTRTVTWLGSLSAGSAFTVSFRVLVTSSLPSSTYIPFPAQIGYDEHSLSFERPYTLRVNAPDLSASTLAVAPVPAYASQRLTYTLTARNSGLEGATATVWATAPNHGVFTGTVDSGGIGVGTVSTATLSWTGPVDAGGEVTLHYNLALDGWGDYWLIHEAWVSDQYGEEWPVEVRTEVQYRKTYLPLVRK